MVPSDLEYEVRPYRLGDEEQIVPLLQLVFNGWRDLDFWRWKYLDNPLKMNVIAVGVINEMIIGYDGTILKRIKIGESVLLCSYGTDAAVHPDFRRRGVNKNISILKRDLRRKAGIKFNYFGTENPIVINSHSKINPIFPYFLRHFIRIRDIGLHNRMKPPISQSVRVKRLFLHATNIINDLRNTLDTMPPNEDIRISEIHQFDDKVDKFWDEIRDHYDFIVERTKEHLNWNYCDPRGGDFTVKVAEEDGRMLGYMVLETKDDGKYPSGEIIDLLVVPGRMDAADALMADAVGVFDGSGVNMCSSLLVEGHPYEKVFKRHGFIDVRRKVHVFYRCPEKDDESSRRVREILEAVDADRVHLSRGDLL